MKNSLKYILLVFLIGINSCSEPMNKSVTEPIPIEELKVIIEKDTLFEYTYKAIQKIRETELTDDVEKAKWSDMTYKKIYDLVHFYRDSSAQSKYSKKIKKEWESKYGKYSIKADSISDYWKKYIKENSINNYAKVELFDIQNSRVGLKITPLKGSIDVISIYYSFIKKDEIDEILSFERHPSIYEKKSFFVELPRTEKPKVFWKKDDEFNKILKNKTLDEVLENYVFKFNITRIEVNGIYHSDILSIKELPSSVKWMIENESSKSSGMWREGVIKEYLSEDYVRYDKYYFFKIDSIAKTLYPNEIKFINLMGKEKDK